MKLIGYDLYKSQREDTKYQCFTFESEAGYKVEVRVEESGEEYIRSDDGITFEEVKEVIAVIESGKIEIEILWYCNVIQAWS